MKKKIILSLFLIIIFNSLVMAYSQKDTLFVSCIESKSNGIMVQSVKEELFINSKLDSLSGQKLEVIYSFKLVRLDSKDYVKLYDLKYVVLYNLEFNKSVFIFNKNSYRNDDFFISNSEEISTLYDELYSLIINYLSTNKLIFSAECGNEIDLDFVVYINFK